MGHIVLVRKNEEPERKDRLTGGGMEGFLEGAGGRGWWGSTWIVASFVQTSSVENGAIAQIVVFFMCSVSDVKPICLPGPNSKDPYLLFSSSAFPFSSPLSRKPTFKMLSPPPFFFFCKAINHAASHLEPLFDFSRPLLAALFTVSPHSRAKFSQPFRYSYYCKLFCLSRCPSQTSDCLPFGAGSCLSV